jgi:hypothetical protein
MGGVGDGKAPTLGSAAWGSGGPADTPRGVRALLACRRFCGLLRPRCGLAAALVSATDAQAVLKQLGRIRLGDLEARREASCAAARSRSSPGSTSLPPRRGRGASASYSLKRARRAARGRWALCSDGAVTLKKLATVAAGAFLLVEHRLTFNTLIWVGCDGLQIACIHLSAEVRDEDFTLSKIAVVDLAIEVDQDLHQVDSALDIAERHIDEAKVPRGACFTSPGTKGPTFLRERIQRLI